MEPDKKEKAGFNLKDILLPKKEGRTPASAERINAGVLLEREQNATLVPMPENTPSDRVGTPMTEQERKDAPIAPLQTYEGDVASVIDQKNVSAVSIAAAEAERRGRSALNPADSFKKIDWDKLTRGALITGGIALVGVAALVLLFIVTRPLGTVQAPDTLTTPFIAVDDAQVLVVKQEQWNRAIIMQNLNDIRTKTAISLGLISRSYISIASSTEGGKELPPQVSAQELLVLIAPNTSDELRRTLGSQEYLLGVHVFDGNQSFLIFKVDSYEQAFSGMLAWERTMRQELLPLFDRQPRPRTSDEPLASTTTPQLIQTSFVDQIVENHDARVIKNEVGDILLLWAFLDRDTLVVTTNEGTLREIISRHNSFTPKQ